MNDISPAAVPRFTRDLAADAVVQFALDKLFVSLGTTLGPIRTIFLAGSYGRGEGSVVDGRVVNDIDLFFLSASPLPYAARRSIRAALPEAERAASVPHVDVMFETEDSFARLPLSMARYDALAAGQVVYGEVHRDAGFLLPQNPPFPESEILNLLINRGVTLLEAHPDVEGKRPPWQRSRQLAKVVWALVDAENYDARSYVTKYESKLAAFRVLPETVYTARLKQLLQAILPFWHPATSGMSALPADFESLWSTASELLVSAISLRSAHMNNPRGLDLKGKLGRDAVAVWKRRPVKWRVERWILRLLERYDGSPAWAGEAERAVASWHRS